eukprot:746115-Hanusia_phi.AAC.8
MAAASMWATIMADASPLPHHALIHTPVLFRLPLSWIPPSSEPAHTSLIRAKEGLMVALRAKAEAIKSAEEIQAEKIRKIARSVDQVLGSVITGFIGPWIIGWIFGTMTGFKGNGFKGAMSNGFSTGTAWGTMSAAFCGVEVLAREIRGTTDKWNNMMGACSAGVVGNCGKGVGAMASGCVNFAAMSYIIDLFIDKKQDPFEQYAKDPNSQEKDLLRAQHTNKKES